MPEPEVQLLLVRLNALLEQLLPEHRDFLRADMDEIAMITAVCETVLPKRFVETVNASDENFPADGWDRGELLNRFIRILEVAKDVPETEGSRESSELLPMFTLPSKDKDRVRKLCDDMRKIIFASPDFDEPHKKKALK